DLDGLDAGSKVDMASLKFAGIVRGTYDGLRVLGDRPLTKAVHVTADHVTAGAKTKIEAAGGTVTLIPPPKKPVRNKMGQGKWSKKNGDGTKKATGKPKPVAATPTPTPPAPADG
ncbi:MAG: uL15 family ribosomal protein, partial [Fimbriiglobus sp.]